MKEMNPLCVLDFYTYEGCQRKGYGKEIYTAMIKAEKTEPRKLGYDRPSFKFLNFLKKYYNLEEFVPQNNNFVVFNDYFLVKEEPKVYHGKKFGNVYNDYKFTNKTPKYDEYEKENQYGNYILKQEDNSSSYKYKSQVQTPSYHYTRSNADYGAFVSSSKK